jgi:outer membrane receptor for ferrienterochelin and colicins
MISLRQLCLFCVSFSCCILPLRSLSADYDNNHLSRRLVEMDLQELMNVEIPTVYAASRRSESATNAPSSITVITAEDIKKFGYRNIKEALQSVPGFFTTSDRDYEHVGVRGFIRAGDYDTRILMLLNGKRINENVYGSFGTGDDFIVDLDVVKQIEVIRGPGSSLYGSNAFLAVINVVTKAGEEVDGMEVAASVGTFDSYTSRLTYGGVTEDGMDYLLSASALNSHGDPHLYYEEYDYPASNDGWADNADAVQAGNLFFSIAYNEWTVEVAHAYRDENVPTAAFGSAFNDNRFDDQDIWTHLSVVYEKQLEKDLELDIKTYYNQYEYRARYPYEYSDLDDSSEIVLNHDYGYGNSVGTIVHLSKLLEHGHVISGGLEYNFHFNQDQENYDEVYNWIYTAEYHDSYDLGVYLQTKLMLRDSLELHAGVRLDSYESFGETCNPRLGLVYNPFKATILKLLYGQAFRAPNAFETYYDLEGWSQKGNLDLDPERMKTLEAVWEQVLSPGIRSTLSVYRYHINDLISQIVDPDDGMLVFENLDKVTTNGVELTLLGAWEGVRTQFSYAFQNAKDNTLDSDLINSPKQVAKARFVFPCWEKYLSAATEVLYLDRRKTVKGSWADDYWVVNFTLLSQLLNDELDFSFSIYNVFDEEYGDPGSLEHLQDVIEEDGRTYRAKVVYRF